MAWVAPFLYDELQNFLLCFEINRFMFSFQTKFTCTLYLGQLIDMSKRIEGDIKRRVKFGWSAFERINAIFKACMHGEKEIGSICFGNNDIWMRNFCIRHF